MTPFIPAPVPVPLPAPSWLLLFLLVFTFILHVLAMNCLLGGTLILSVSSFLGRSKPIPREFVRRASLAMPSVAAFTITLGVAPLLFVQLVYGQLYFTTSDLMAWYWLAVVLLVMLGYYGIYWFQLKQDHLGPAAPWVMLVAAIIFLQVAFLFSKNMMAMLLPPDFYALFLKGTVGNILGPISWLNVARLLHVIVGALAVAGLAVALLSRRWLASSPELAGWAKRYGITWFMSATLVQFLGGLWFLFSLPVEIRHQILGSKLGAGILVLAIITALLALMIVPRHLLTSSVAILMTISLMAVLRHIVRTAYLQPYFDPGTLPVRGQWIVFSIFVILLLAGLATVGWMLYVLFRPVREPSASS